MFIYNRIAKLFKNSLILYCIGSVLTIYNLFSLLISSLNNKTIFCNTINIYPSLLDFSSMIIIIILVARISWKYQRTNTQPITGRLQKRIVVTFSLITAAPITVLAIVFLLFLSICTQKWLNKYSNKYPEYYTKANNVDLEQDVNGLKKLANIIANDLAYIPILESYKNKHQLCNVLNRYKKLKLIDDAAVFHANSKSVIATACPHTLFNTSVFECLINITNDEAVHDDNKIVNISDNVIKIEVIKKLQNYDGLYLGISQIKNRQNVVNNLLPEEMHYCFKKQTLCLQLKFFITFTCLALLLLLMSIHIGFIIANKIFHPIKELVNATETVKLGNLKAQLEQTNTGDELDILTAAFNHMIKQLDYQSKDLAIAQRALAWSDVARRVAHEINNPLTPIQLSANMLSVKFANEVKDSCTFNKYIDTILRHTEDIKKIIKEFTNFAKIPTPTFVRCDLVAIIRESIESRQIINENVEYRFISELEELDFIADITQINQIIINLLKNSEEALEAKCVTSKVITISLQQKSPSSVSIEIQDTGSGFPPNLINYITEPYVTTRSRGSGLGLAIVKKIVEDHFGILKIRNLPSGTGASVKIIFDYHKLQAAFRPRKK